MTLKNKTISGVVWNSAGNIARQVLTIITLIVMARFLSPDDFGIFAILMIFVTFMNIFASMGTSQAVIHLDNPNQRMLSSIFYFNVAMGVVLFGLLYVLASPIAAFFEQPSLAHLLQLIGLTFILTTVSLVQKALLEKEMLFKRVVMIETVALTLSSILGMCAAVLDFGIYSLIILTLTNAGILTLGLWISAHWIPSFKFSLEDIKQIWNYSMNLTGFSFINYFARQADQILIGKFVGSGALGIYSVAYKIMLYPLENISRVIVRVLFPAFSEIKHDNERFKNAYIKAISFIALVTFPLMVGLFAVSQNFVDVVLGKQWFETGVLLMILAPIGLMQSIVTTVGSIYMGKGNTGLMFKIGALNAVVTVISFVIGIPYGVEGVAISYAIANLIMLYPNLKISWDLIDLEVFEGLGKLMPYLLVSIFMGVLVYLIGLYLEQQIIAKILILIIQIMLGGLIYIGVLLLFYRSSFLGLIDTILKHKVA